MKNSIYENDNYAVVVNASTPIKVGGVKYDRCYDVVNKTQAQVEFKTNCLPEALHVAVQYHLALRTDRHLAVMGLEDEGVEVHLPGEDELDEPEPTVQ